MAHADLCWDIDNLYDASDNSKVFDFGKFIAEYQEPLRGNSYRILLVQYDLSKHIYL